MQLQSAFLLLLAPYLRLSSIAFTLILTREATFTRLLSEKFPHLGMATKTDTCPFEYHAKLSWKPFRLLEREVATVDAGVYRRLTSEHIEDGVMTVIHHPSGHVTKRRYQPVRDLSAINECQFLQDTLNTQVLWPNFEGFVFNPRHLLFNHILNIQGHTTYGGRPAILLHARPRTEGVIDWIEESWALADHYIVTVDAETGMMLAFQAFYKDSCYEWAEVQDLQVTPAPIVTSSLPLYHGGSW
jgi:hypothetical protein